MELVQGRSISGVEPSVSAMESTSLLSNGYLGLFP
jgi:hypothetical protein